VSGPRAAVDVGSNSVRLLVVDAGGVRLTREMTVTRLASGMDRRGRFDGAAFDRTLDTIRRYAGLWRAHDIDDADVRIAATSAVRDAEDRDRFVSAVAEATGGIRLEVLTGEQEAALTFRGAAGAVPAALPTLVVDVGGGSTELVLGAAEVAGSVSLQLGCVRLTERHLAHDPPSGPERRAARDLVETQLDLGEAELARQGAALKQARSLVAVAGTATTVAALHLGLASYDPDRIHGTQVPRPAMEAITAGLVQRTAAERAALGPMQPGRADVIHGGAMILDEVLRRTGLDHLVVSEADILDGLVASA